MLREKGGGEEKERRVCARARVRVWTVRGAGGQGRWGVQVERREREFVGQQERRTRALVWAWGMVLFHGASNARRSN